MDFGSFKLNTPPGWIIIKEQGIDSYVGRLTNGVDTLTFDYGLYSEPIDENVATHLFAHDTLNGLPAEFVIPVVPGKGTIGVFVATGSEVNLRIEGSSIRSTDTILRILKSLVFKGGDTSLNPVLAVSRFKTMPGGTGTTQFRQKCMACHSKRGGDPPTGYFVANRSVDWLYNFFNNRELVKDDLIFIQRKKDFSNECVQFSGLTRDDIEAIRFYMLTR